MNYIITQVTLVTQSHKQKSPQFPTDFFDITSSLLNHSAHSITPSSLPARSSTPMVCYDQRF
ncbi:MAG: hypothetical protein RI995_1075 [Bacteroidota bacterium]